MNIRKQIIDQLDKVEYVSFDVFDTLLFRMVRFPQQIFEKMLEKAPWLFPNYLDACEWKELRMHAEKWAREKKQGKEVTLEEIYGEFPGIIQNRKEIMELEIAVEVENTYINPVMAKILTEAKEHFGKKIILISDMYLSQKDILQILTENGLNISMFSQIFVSSEYGERKCDGSLYDRVCECLDCNPGKILHIGDNWNGDYIKAKKKGMGAVYYPVISEARYQYPYLGYEYEFYGDVGREIYSIRLLAAETELEGDDREWFQMGAMTLGPLFSYAADWVLDIAEETHIKNIYPMMREGFFLSRLLERAAKERRWEGHIEPMYISRKALYPALLAVIKKKDIGYLLDTRNMTVGMAIRLLDLTEKEPFSEFMQYDTLSLSKAKEMFPEKNSREKSIYEILEESLYNPDILKNIQEKSKQADEVIWKYFQELKMDSEDFITFDVGWRGNAQNAVERIRKNRQAASKGIHLLVAGKKLLLKEKNLEDGTDIRGFCGNFGKNARDIANFLPPIIELFLLCEEGTTIGYEILEGKAVPVQKEIIYSQEQCNMMRRIQEGILSFQEQLYAVCRQKRSRIPQRGEELLKIAVRLTALPLKREAKLIGCLEFDQNFGVDEKQKIISPCLQKQYARLGYNEFTYRKLAREYEWYPGMDVCIDPLTHYRQNMFHTRNSFSYQYAMYAERICRDYETFVLVGAGNRLRELLLYLQLMDRTGKVELIMDNDSFLWNEAIEGQRIYPLDTKTQSRVYVITPFKKSVIIQLSLQLQRLKGTDIKIVNVYS